MAVVSGKKLQELLDAINASKAWFDEDWNGSSDQRRLDLAVEDIKFELVLKRGDDD